MTAKYYVQYGCGFHAPKEWKNYDASPTLRFERLPIVGALYTKNATRFPQNVIYGDIVKGLPLPHGSCTGIYASHVLEHLALEDFRRALRNTYDLLSADGIFRLVVPDLETLARHYLTSEQETAASEFMESTGLGLRSRTRGFMGFLMQWFGNSKHLWMWDEKSLRKELLDAGFSNVRRCDFGDAIDPMFSLVEDIDRFQLSAAMECAKG